MYSKKPLIVIGFHGCEQKTRDDLVNCKKQMIHSDKDYDWLGHGMYFWEGNIERAWQWAQEKDGIKIPSVIGAIIDLGLCLDLIDSKYLKMLKTAYILLKTSYKNAKIILPENKKRNPGDTTLLKELDCAVIETLHSILDQNDEKKFDSTRGVFWEGPELYENTDFREKNHIQICVRNPNCIKGFFIPRQTDSNWKIP